MNEKRSILLAMFLAQYLNQSGLTQARFAEMVGTTPANVSRWASGEFRPRWEMIAKIIEVTDGKVTTSDFVVPPPTPQRKKNREKSKRTAVGSYLEKTGQKQKDFAARIGITPAHLSRICQGASMPSLPVAFRIEAATNGAVTAADFMDPPAPAEPEAA